PWLD
ncbi:RNA pseudouridylate synthase family protein, partial [Vibrio parahaemolyticus V-223/04]